MVGLPASGKSTYLGALYHSLAGSSDGSLRLARAPDDREYLLDLERRWLALKPLERSRHRGAKNVQIPIVAADNTQSVLAIPDVVGEAYLEAWLHGGKDEGLLEWLRRADGILLFIRSDNLIEATLISVETVTRASTEKSKRWDAAATPTQGVICDLLEQIAEARSGDLPPIAVVISAWDAAAGQNLSPQAWLNWRTPLLDQWLRANEVEVPFRVFGVSAQGGDLGDEAVRRRLASRIEDRPMPKNGSPIMAPLEWLLDRSRT